MTPIELFVTMIACQLPGMVIYTYYDMRKHLGRKHRHNMAVAMSAFIKSGKHKE